MTADLPEHVPHQPPHSPQLVHIVFQVVQRHEDSRTLLAVKMGSQDGLRPRGEATHQFGAIATAIGVEQGTNPLDLLRRSKVQPIEQEQQSRSNLWLEGGTGITLRRGVSDVSETETK